MEGKKMKKYLSMLFVTIPMMVFAQDDIYFSRKKSGTETKTVTTVTTTKTTTVSAPAASGSMRAVDEYNRRTSYSSDVYANNDYYYDEAEDDYEYTKRLAAFHNANIYVENANVRIDDNGDVYINGISQNKTEYIYVNTTPAYYPSYYSWYDTYWDWTWNWSWRHYWGPSYYSYTWYHPYHYYPYHAYHYYYPYYYHHHH